MGRSVSSSGLNQQGAAVAGTNPVYYRLEVEYGHGGDSEEEEKPLLPERRPPSPGGRLAAAVVCAVMTLCYLYAYHRSLEGGAHSRDLKWMAPHTGERSRRRAAPGGSRAVWRPIGQRAQDSSPRTDLARHRCAAGMIGGFLAAAVLSWSAAQWATVPLAHSHRRAAWAVRGGLAASLMLFLAWDHGEQRAATAGRSAVHSI